MNVEDRRLWLATALLATVIVAVTISGGYKRPSREDEEHENIVPRLEGVVKIGVMASHDETYPLYEFLADMAKLDINAYCIDAGLNCSFEFLLSNAYGKAVNALDLTHMYKSMGIDLVVGYGWSSHVCVTTNYAEANEMVLLSPSSTSPTCAIKDTVYRMSTHDFKEAGPMARILRSCGVTDVVVLKRSDSWGDGLSEKFNERFMEKGGNPSRIIGYVPGITGEAFRPYLEKANKAIERIIDERGQDGTAILVMSFAEVSAIVEGAAEFPALMEVKWFMTGGHSISDEINRKMTTVQAANIGLIRWNPIAPDNLQHRKVNEAFSSEFGRDIDYKEANIYDALWIIALSAIEAGAADGLAIREVLPAVAANYTGITGECSLDANGDRDGADYAIWVFIEADGASESFRCGEYYHESDEIEWDEALIPHSEVS
jgi:branched-chain amino acid transport system substrate-binding protein